MTSIMNLKYAHISSTITKPFCSVSKMPRAWHHKLDRNNNNNNVFVYFLYHFVFCCFCCCCWSLCYSISVVQTRFGHIMNMRYEMIVCGSLEQLYQLTGVHIEAIFGENGNCGANKTATINRGTHAHCEREHFIIICLFRKHLIVDILTSTESLWQHHPQ